MMSADPSVVDKDVEVAKACNCRINHVLDLIFRANIDVKPECSSTTLMDFRDQAFASLLSAMIANRNVRSFLSKQSADLASDAGATAND
jgi:hypothetical protein